MIDQKQPKPDNREYTNEQLNKVALQRSFGFGWAKAFQLANVNPQLLRDADWDYLDEILPDTTFLQ